MYAMVAVTGLCAAGLVTSAILAFSSRTTSKRVLNVLHRREEAPVVKRQGDLRRKLLQFAHRIGERLGMADDPRLLESFERAGITSSSSRDLYMAARIAGPAAVLVIGISFESLRSFWLISVAAILYLLPSMLLKHRIKRRREKIRLSVPDAVDLLVICVDAGLGMDQAMLRVAQELGKRHPEMHQELLRINREQRAGKPRIEAWQSMADRTQVPEIEAFVNMLMQTERFGTPIARALSNFGEGIRQKRRQRAEELAAKTTVKIIFPLVLCIFPSIFIVLLGPSGISIAHGLATDPSSSGLPF
jgi:tight adherence protein C